MRTPWAFSSPMKFHASHGMVSGPLFSSRSTGRPAWRHCSTVWPKSSDRKAMWWTNSPRLARTLWTQVSGVAGAQSWIDTPSGSGFWKVAHTISTPSPVPPPRVRLAAWPGDSTAKMSAQSAMARSRSWTHMETWSMCTRGIAWPSSLSPVQLPADHLSTNRLFDKLYPRCRWPAERSTDGFLPDRRAAALPEDAARVGGAGGAEVAGPPVGGRRVQLPRSAVGEDERLRPPRHRHPRGVRRPGRRRDHPGHHRPWAGPLPRRADLGVGD